MQKSIKNNKLFGDSSSKLVHSSSPSDKRNKPPKIIGHGSINMEKFTKEQLAQFDELIKMQIAPIKNSISDLKTTNDLLVKVLAGDLENPNGALNKISVIQEKISTLPNKEELKIQINDAKNELNNIVDKKLPNLLIYGLPLGLVLVMVAIATLATNGIKDDVNSMKRSIEGLVAKNQK